MSADNETIPHPNRERPAHRRPDHPPPFPRHPWSKSRALRRRVSVSGDGQITLVLGGILALLGILRRTGRSNPIWVAIIVAGLIVAIGGYYYNNNSDEELISIGIGIYGTIDAGIVGFIGALIARQNRIITAAPAATPAGWYRDPTGRPTALRYWDGTSWTEYTAEAPQP
jgi:Protein of unknown function (DUF2510)